MKWKEPKKARGIALRPSLWRRIDAVAERQQKSRNEVMEEVLSLHVPAVDDFRNERVNSREYEVRDERGVFE